MISTPADRAITAERILTELHRKAAIQISNRATEVSNLLREQHGRDPTLFELTEKLMVDPQMIRARRRFHRLEEALNRCGIVVVEGRYVRHAEAEYTAGN